jgi:hypothetical protein
MKLTESSSRLNQRKKESGIKLSYTELGSRDTCHDSFHSDPDRQQSGATAHINISAHSGTNTIYLHTKVCAYPSAHPSEILEYGMMAAYCARFLVEDRKDTLFPLAD